MRIAAPTLPTDHPDRPLACEEALHEPFYSIASIDPDHAWTGDESAVWPLRKAAHLAGWEVDEIDSSLARLAATLRNALEPGRPG